MTLEESIRIFNDYTSQFDLNNRSIKMKYDHSFRVMDLCTDIAKKLGYSESDTILAGLLGLFHDIGRFVQFTLYNTYNDNKTPKRHAEMSVDVLSEELKDRFSLSEDEWRIFITAIAHHTERFLSTDLQEDETRFCKLLRDADKIDIVGIMHNNIANNKENVFYHITYDQLIACKPYNRATEYARKRLPMSDDMPDNPYCNLLRYASFSYQLEYEASRQLLKELHYLDSNILTIEFKRPDTQKAWEEVKTIIKSELDITG